jgi:nucleoside-diphosphate-sugar epimerase
MKSEILVTGATGFLGCRLVVALQSCSYLVRQHSRADGDIASCSLPMNGVSHVFHLAAKTFVPESWRDPRVFYEVNVIGTLNVLEHCRRHQAALTLVSSYVYGHPQRLPIAEDHPIAAYNPYSHTKILAEDIARFYEQHYGVRVVIVRPFNLYGPGQHPSFLIPSIVRQVLDPSAKEVRVKDLRPKRDYLYVEDAVALLAATLRSGVRGTYNAGSGSSVSVAEVARLVNQAAGVDKPIISDEEPRPEEVMDVISDVSRAAAELNWRPSTSLPSGIAAVVAAQQAVRRD